MGGGGEGRIGRNLGVTDPFAVVRRSAETLERTNALEGGGEGRATTVALSRLLESATRYPAFEYRLQSQIFETHECQPLTIISDGSR